MKLGIISDTHGHLDPKIFKLFEGVDHILHAGDIGFASIVLELEAIAPVTAVIGNTDMDLPFKETEVLQVDRHKFLIHHIVNPHSPSDRARERIARARPTAVIFGHTHKRFAQAIDGIFFFNPGYSGKPKAGTERSAALLHLDGKEIRHEFLAL